MNSSMAEYKCKSQIFFLLHYTHIHTKKDGQKILKRQIQKLK